MPSAIERSGVSFAADRYFARDSSPPSSSHRSSMPTEFSPVSRGTKKQKIQDCSALIQEMKHTDEIEDGMALMTMVDTGAEIQSPTARGAEEDVTNFWFKLLGVCFCAAIALILLLLGSMLPGKSAPAEAPKNIIFMVSDGDIQLLIHSESYPLSSFSPCVRSPVFVTVHCQRQVSGLLELHLPGPIKIAWLTRTASAPRQWTAPRITLR